MTTTRRSEHDQAEIRLLGLILMQSVSIGLAVGIFDTRLWLRHDDPLVNGMTYSMGAFAVQGLAYYVFKMFFQQGMDEKARIAQMERERRTRSSQMNQTFEQRRQDMELRMQERQLDAELRWMEANPGQVPPWLEERIGLSGGTTTEFMPEMPGQNGPLDLGLNFDSSDDDDDRERNSDGTFKGKKE